MSLVFLPFRQGLRFFLHGESRQEEVCFDSLVRHFCSNLSSHRLLSETVAFLMTPPAAGELIPLPEPRLRRGEDYGIIDEPKKGGETNEK